MLEIRCSWSLLESLVSTVLKHFLKRHAFSLLGSYRSLELVLRYESAADCSHNVIEQTFVNNGYLLNDT